MRTGTMHCLFAAALVAGVGASGASAAPVLPDWTAATFGANSADLTNPFFAHPSGLLSVYEGEEEDGFERIKTYSTFHTVNILGVENRVIRDKAYVDGRLVEVADDWYAQDTDGNVWYFGEFVVNYHYDGAGNLIGTDNGGSWIADGAANLPGITMMASPMIGDEYYQEYAPGVALDFALVTSLTDVVDIDYGYFENVLNTAEGNLFDGPELVENKLYASGTGLVLVEVLDDEGDVEFEVELIRQRIVPAPGGAAMGAIALGLLGRRRRMR